MFQSLSNLWTGNGELAIYSKVAEDDGGRYSTDSIAREELRLLEKIRNQRRTIIGLLCFSILLFLMLAGQAAYYTRLSWSTAGRVPPMPKQSITFERNDLFVAASSTETDLAWAALVPATKGFVRVEHAAKYNLPPGIDDKQQPGELYNIAAFHQLYCLASIRTYLWHFRSAADRNQTQQLEDIMPESQEVHVTECFDYLRQSIMCAGDMTLEYPSPTSSANHSRQMIDGWGVKHQCVDWDAVLQYTKDNSPPSLDQL